MPITRRRRANPPEQPENNHHQPVEQAEGATEQQAQSDPAVGEAGEISPIEPVTSSPLPEAQPSSEMPGMASMDNVDVPPTNPPPSNGDRGNTDYSPTIEGGRRTVRGELFRRAPQVPVPPQASFVSSAPLQAPTHEITLPLGNLLHLAYNPGYTGSEEARSLLLHRLSEESQAGGRARCWNCGSLAIAYDRWNTRSRSFGEVGIAFCEICGVWSVM